MSFEDSYIEKLNKVIYNVRKPTRYVGGEYNCANFNKKHNLKMCICFPDMYEIGMSNLGIKILYHMLNELDKVVCGRCFTPDLDMLEEMKKEDIPLFILEDKSPLISADILGFSVQFEMLYSNILVMLNLAKIPFLAKDRDESYPLILGGGPCMVNPEPIAEFFDLIVIGEGEDSTREIAELYLECKKNKILRKDFLQRAKNIEGVYVPSLEVTEEDNGFTVIKNATIKKAVVKDFENVFVPTNQIVSNLEIVHDRGVYELYRGCANGCRFCQAGFYYRPIRAKSCNKAFEQCKTLMENTGYDELSLSSLSTSDYKFMNELVPKLSVYAKENNIKLSLPSLRLDSYDTFMTENVRKSSLTFAPEAGTERLRRVINKNITEEDIEKSLIKAFKQGYTSIKMYFMIGLPTETMEDLDGIELIVRKARALFFEHRAAKGGLNVSVSASVFIPKPSTPFQWEKQLDLEEIRKRQFYLKDKFKTIKGASFSYHDSHTSIMEAVFARGDRKLSKVIIKAFELGARFDSWTEYFNYEIWENAFKLSEVDMYKYIGKLNENDVMPWDFIDYLVTKKYLLKEKENAYNEISTKSCVNGCNGCGNFNKVKCDM